MMFQFSLHSSSAAVAAAVFLASAPINADRFPSEMRNGSVDKPLSTENNPYIPRKLVESNGNDDLDVHNEGIKRSLSIENTIWPANRGYQPTIKNSLRASQTDNNKATTASREAQLLNTPSVDLGIIEKGIRLTNIDVPAITDADRERYEAETLAALNSSAFTGYYEASSSDTSTSYQTDELLVNPTTGARSLSDSYCYEKCGDPSQRPTVTDNTIKKAIRKCKDDNTASKCPYSNIEMQCWNTSAVTYMGYFFSGYTNFNEPLGCWDVSSATEMPGMFQNAESFNQNINRWDVSAVTDMAHMFSSSYVFNQPLEDWNTISVENMSEMFSYAMSFNQPIGGWNVESVTETYSMFRQAETFNQPLDEWDLSSVGKKNSFTMFAGSSFNQCLSLWTYPESEFLRNNVNMFEYTKCPNYSCYGTECPTEDPTESPTENPTESPTENPTESPNSTESPTENPTESPTKNPTESPTTDPCQNKSEPFSSFLSCDKLSNLLQESVDILCNDPTNDIATNCPGLCSEGSTCSSTPSPTINCADKTIKFEIDLDGSLKKRRCSWLASVTPKNQKEYCKKKVKINGGMQKLPTVCRETCGKIGKGVCAFLMDLE